MGYTPRRHSTQLPHRNSRRTRGRLPRVRETNLRSRSRKLCRRHPRSIPSADPDADDSILARSSRLDHTTSPLPGQQHRLEPHLNRGADSLAPRLSHGRPLRLISLQPTPVQRRQQTRRAQDSRCARTRSTGRPLPIPSMECRRTALHLHLLPSPLASRGSLLRSRPTSPNNDIQLTAGSSRNSTTRNKARIHTLGRRKQAKCKSHRSTRPHSPLARS